jgi:hypothetical protein
MVWVMGSREKTFNERDFAVARTVKDRAPPGEEKARRA